MILPFLSVSCSKIWGPSTAEKKITAEKTVRRFLDISATTREHNDKNRLVGLCTGEMKKAFEKMSQETFELAYLKSDLVIKDLKILDTQMSDKSAKIQYEISIENVGGTDTTQETTKREVDLTQIDGQWYLENIRPIGKDTITFKQGMIF